MTQHSTELDLPSPVPEESTALVNTKCPWRSPRGPQATCKATFKVEHTFSWSVFIRIPSLQEVLWWPETGNWVSHQVTDITGLYEKKTQKRDPKEETWCPEGTVSSQGREHACEPGHLRSAECPSQVGTIERKGRRFFAKKIPAPWPLLTLIVSELRLLLLELDANSPSLFPWNDPKRISWGAPQTTLKRETQSRMGKCVTPQARNEAESPWSMLTVRGK